MLLGYTEINQYLTNQRVFHYKVAAMRHFNAFLQLKQTQTYLYFWQCTVYLQNYGTRTSSSCATLRVIAWWKWRKLFEVFLKASEVSKVSKEVQAGVLVNQLLNIVRVYRNKPVLNRLRVSLQFFTYHKALVSFIENVSFETE